MLRVGTRASALALRQTDIAIEAMLRVRPDLLIEIVEISTQGDRDKTTPLDQLGTKAVFAHELEAALLDGRIDVAAHSLKDLTGTEPAGLELVAVLERSDPRDVLVSRTGQTLAELDDGAIVGTSSIRREALIREARPNLRTAPLRGNVDTRLRKVADGEVDAAILAAAGLIRLDRTDAITEWLDPAVFVPPPGQGAIALETRVGDQAWLAGANHASTRACVDAERAFMHVVEGSCEMPLGAYARVEGGGIVLDAFLADREGRHAVRETAAGDDPRAVGESLARRVLEGADFLR
jgi:hydroxymethylbilane synthase